MLEDLTSHFEAQQEPLEEGTCRTGAHPQRM